MNTIKKIVNYIKNVVNVAIAFLTGLGFYGLGLLVGALVTWLLFGWSHIAAGLFGAFLFKNFKAIVDFFKDYVLK